MITYAKIGLTYRTVGNGFRKGIASAFPLETPKTGFHIANPEEMPEGLVMGLISYDPADQFCRFIPAKRVEGALRLEASM